MNDSASARPSARWRGPSRSWLPAAMLGVALASVSCSAPTRGGPDLDTRPLATTVSIGSPRGLAIDDGVLYTYDLDRFVLHAVDLETGRLATIPASRPLPYVTDLASDRAGGTIVVSEPFGQLFRIRLSDGEVTTVAGTGERRRGVREGPAPVVELAFPESPVVDQNGHVYFIDDSRLLRVDAQTNALTVVMDRSASLTHVTSLVLDPSGDFYIGQTTDDDEAYIKQIDVDTGRVETLAGPDTPVDADPAIAGGNAPFWRPRFLTADRKGGLLFADRDRVLRLDIASRRIRVMAGSGFGRSDGDGSATSARFGYPDGLAVDAGGQIFVVYASVGSVMRLDPRTGRMRSVAGNGERLDRAESRYHRGTASWMTTVCDDGRQAPELAVRVVDAAGGGLPATLHLLDRAEPAPIASRTDRDGRAAMAVSASQDHTLLATSEGFHPEARLVRIEPGCRGSLPIVMDPAIR